MAKIKPTATFGGKQPPVDEFKEQYIFLLEFFVNEITSERLAKLNHMFFVPTCVSFRFLDFDDQDIEVTPVNPLFEPQAGIADDVEEFYAGRSVLFALGQRTIANKIKEFKVHLTVRKKMPEKISTDVCVGAAIIDLTKQFCALRKEMLQCWRVDIPPPKVFEDEVPIRYEGCVSGIVNVYLRMSAFGQNIITEFDGSALGKSASSFVFKTEDSQKHHSYKCRRLDPENFDTCTESKDRLQIAKSLKEPKKAFCVPCDTKDGAEVKPTCPKPKPCPNLKTSAPEKSSGSCDPPPPACPAAEKSTCCPPAKGSSGLIQSSRGPPDICGTAVVLKVSGLLDVENADGKRKNPTVTVAPECDATDPSQLQDPDHDVFILRIGKKGLVGVGEKSDIQLEMKTPKGPERRPPIRCETRETQTEDDGDAKGKGKGKGGKGKKK